MDQVKEFLRQCVKYRFWIAFGISLLLPMIGYFVGVGTIVAATGAREKEINDAKTGIQKYQAANPPVPKYAELVGEKKASLSADVDATWRKLYAIQEPLLKWPEVVEDKFRKWGRKWPENVDRGQVQQAIIDYSIAYRDFVARVYQTCNPWNPEDGKGVVFVPDMDNLLTPAPFSSDAPPPLGKVWAEQERLWVATALLDVVAKANAAAKAKDWDGAIIKEILSLEVGTPTSEDQKSLAKGLVLEPSPVLNPDGTVAAAATGTTASSGPEAGLGMPMGMSMGGAAGKNQDVYSIKPEGTPPYKILPVRMTVLVDQAHLPDFLVGLENSPMAIQVLEPEVSRPSSPVVKPVYGETNFAAGGGGMGMGMGMGMAGNAGYSKGRQEMTGFGPGAMGGRGGNADFSGNMGMGRMGAAGGAATKKGASIRDQDKAKARKDEAKKDASKKAVARKTIDPYYNIVEVTVYGQARFYNTPPAAPVVEPSTAAPAPAPAAAEAPKAEVPAQPAPDAAKKDEPAKPEEPGPAPKADAPKADAPKS